MLSGNFWAAVLLLRHRDGYGPASTVQVNLRCAYSNVPHTTVAYLASTWMPKHCCTFKACACVACSSDCTQASKLCSSLLASSVKLQQHCCCGVYHDACQQVISICYSACTPTYMQHQTSQCAAAAAAVHVAGGIIQVCARNDGQRASTLTSLPQGIASRASGLKAGAPAPGCFELGKGGRLQQVSTEQGSDMLPAHASAQSSPACQSVSSALICDADLLCF